MEQHRLRDETISCDWLEAPSSAFAGFKSGLLGRSTKEYEIFLFRLCFIGHLNLVGASIIYHHRGETKRSILKVSLTSNLESCMSSKFWTDFGIISKTHGSHRAVIIASSF